MVLTFFFARHSVQGNQNGKPSTRFEIRPASVSEESRLHRRSRDYPGARHWRQRGDLQRPKRCFTSPATLHRFEPISDFVDGQRQKKPSYGADFLPQFSGLAQAKPGFPGHGTSPSMIVSKTDQPDCHLRYRLDAGKDGGWACIPSEVKCPIGCEISQEKVRFLQAR